MKLSKSFYGKFILIKKINTNIPQKKSKNCYIYVQKTLKCYSVTSNGEIHIQIDGVAMNSPLDPVPSNIIMGWSFIELEKILIPKLGKEIKLWRRFVDDTIYFAKTDSLNCILFTINGFRKNIKFTMEIEQDSTIPFLDVLLIRTPQMIHTNVYRKKTNTNLYIHWNSFAPNNWKLGTLETLVRRAYETCSTDEYLRDKLKHIRVTFNHVINYPHSNF